jgi:hypothetical protein
MAENIAYFARDFLMFLLLIRTSTVEVNRLYYYPGKSEPQAEIGGSFETFGFKLFGH